MNDDDLIAILRREEQRAQVWQTEQSKTRTQALKYYNREPYGDEEEGQSKVVTSEFADTVESMLPGFMEVFVSGEDIVEFAPMEQADEQAAKEANLYVPHVFMRENDGFRITYIWLKDALMSRLGVAIVDVEEVEKQREDQITGWTQEEVDLAPQILMQKVPDAEDIEVNAEPDPLTGMFNGTISYKRKIKRVIVDNVAPEDFLCTPRARDIDAASFKGYRKETTSSELRIMGMKQADIDELSSDRPASIEEDQRQDGQPLEDRKGSERTLYIVVAYVRADDDGDGISEMLRCVYAHAGGGAAKIIEKMEWDEPEAPIAPATPILMPHQLVGKSLFDQTQDLQDIGTTLTRGMLDNIYMTNRPRPAINSRVSVSSVIDWVPGMPIQVEGNDNPANSVAWLQIPSIIAPALSGLEYFATQRENRTGANRVSQGLDAESYNKTATGAQIMISGAQQRQVLMARTFAQTAFTRLMRLIYRAIKRCAKGPTSYYANGEWQNCDPSKWPDDMHLVASVGMGSGNKQMQIQNLMMIGAGQEKLILSQGGPDGPIVTMEHQANTMRKLVEAAGFRATEQFVSSQRELEDPSNKQPPKQDPEMVKVQAKAQADQATLLAKTQADQQALQANMQLKRMEMESDIQLQRERAQADMQIARERAALDLQIAREKAALDAQLKSQELMAETALGKYEIDHAPKPANGATNIREQQVSS